MSVAKIIVLGILCFVAFACNDEKVSDQQIDALINVGEFSKAKDVLRILIAKDSNSAEKEALEIKLETIDRLQKEFPLTRDDVIPQLKKYYSEVSHEMLDKWETSGDLEMRLVDGEKRYFKRAVSNFFRINKEAKALKESVEGKNIDGVEKYQLRAIPELFENKIANSNKPFDQRRIKVNYTVKLKADAVPAGETVRCWLPFPRINKERLPKVELLSNSEKEYIIAPESQMQRTIYMEKQAVKGEETFFNVSYVFDTAARWFKVEAENVLPYHTNSELYQKYTKERLPHIVFSEEVISLAKQIVGEETNPVLQVKRLYYWLNDHIPWSGALEYSVMHCIPEYVLKNQRGDCGMQTFLFLSMARSLGIPCKWQSGWYLLPETKNLHDWAEVYYEGVGWVPVDPSFKLIDSEDKRIKEFYLNGMDSYRLIVNDDYAQELYPKKKYYRSEPFDFQRGELEWSGGNLYFDNWSYNMEVEYLD